MSTSTKEAGEIDPELLKRVESGRTLVRNCMAASFAGCLLIIGAGLQGAEVRSAMYALTASLPLLGIHYMVTTPGHERQYHVSVLMKATTILGMLAMVVGLGLLFERGAPGAGVLLGVSGFACLMICVQSNDRAIARARKKVTSMKIAA